MLPRRNSLPHRDPCSPSHPTITVGLATSFPVHQASPAPSSTTITTTITTATTTSIHRYGGQRPILASLYGHCVVATSSCFPLLRLQAKPRSTPPPLYPPPGPNLWNRNHSYEKCISKLFPCVRPQLIAPRQWSNLGQGPGPTTTMLICELAVKFHHQADS